MSLDWMISKAYSILNSSMLLSIQAMSAGPSPAAAAHLAHSEGSALMAARQESEAGGEAEEQFEGACSSSSSGEGESLCQRSARLTLTYHRT